MNWEDYSRRFRARAQGQGRGEDYIASCLRYAKRLHAAGLPVIYDAHHLADRVGYDPLYVFACCYSTERFYRSYEVPKKRGGTRQISEPLPSLKEIQRWILDRILYSVPVSRFAKGFVPGRSVAENARFHHGQPVVLSLDLKDYFPSFTRRRVTRLFKSWGYSRSVSGALGYLCTLDGRLPQGAPTSPAISNHLFRAADKRIGAYALKAGWRYTRYADDITLSGDVHVGVAIRHIEDVLKGTGLELNHAKTRVMRRGDRQEVTGVVVNERSRAPVEVRRELRQIAHYIGRYGLGSHLARIGESRARYVHHVLGLAAFVLTYQPEQRDAMKLRELLLPIAKDMGRMDV